MIIIYSYFENSSKPNNMHKKHTLKEVLSTDQHQGLSEDALSLTGEHLEKIAKGQKDISESDRAALIKLAVSRVKDGKNIFPYDGLDFGDFKEGDPQW